MIAERYMVKAKLIDNGEWVIGSPVNLEYADSDDVGTYIVPRYPTIRHGKELRFDIAFNATKVDPETMEPVAVKIIEEPVYGYEDKKPADYNLLCPNCEAIIYYDEHYEYCYHCGQRLSWGKIR